MTYLLDTVELHHVYSAMSYVWGVLNMDTHCHEVQTITTAAVYISLTYRNVKYVWRKTYNAEQGWQEKTVNGNDTENIIIPFNFNIGWRPVV